MVRCPTCRTEAARDDLEVVEYTATAQWDALLSVATSWAKIDRRGSQDTSDEEAEEEFIDDGTTETKYLFLTIVTAWSMLTIDLQVCVRGIPSKPSRELTGAGYEWSRNGGKWNSESEWIADFKN